MTNAMISSEEAQSYQSKGLSPRRRTYEVGMRGLLYLSAGITRSEERRVGKECRSRWSPYH